MVQVSQLTCWITLVAAALLAAPAQSRRARHAPWVSSGLHAAAVRCARCPPGWGVERRCVGAREGQYRDTACTPCRDAETYSPHHSARAACVMCSRCGAGLFVAKECTVTHDTVCAACHPPPPLHRRNEDYALRCSRHVPREDDDEYMLSDAPAVEAGVEDRHDEHPSSPGHHDERPGGLGHHDEHTSGPAHHNVHPGLLGHRNEHHTGPGHHDEHPSGPGHHTKVHPGGLGHHDGHPGGLGHHGLASYGLSQSSLPPRSKSDMARSILADPGAVEKTSLAVGATAARGRLPHVVLGDEDDVQEEYSLLQHQQAQAGPAYSVLTDEGPVLIAPTSTREPPKAVAPPRPPPPRYVASPVRISSPVAWGRPSAPSLNTRQTRLEMNPSPASSSDMTLPLRHHTDDGDMNAEEVGRLML